MEPAPALTVMVFKKNCFFFFARKSMSPSTCFHIPPLGGSSPSATIVACFFVSVFFVRGSFFWLDVGGTGLMLVVRTFVD